MRGRGLPGPRPGWSRAGTAPSDDVAVRVVRALGMRVAGFDVNADGGATFSPGQVATQLSTVRAGSIVIAHLSPPRGGTAAGFALGLPRLLDGGVRFRTLSDAVG